MGIGEIRIRLGVSKQWAGQLTHRVDFPRPCAELIRGKVWLADEVEAWIRVHRPDLADGQEACVGRSAGSTA